VQVVGFFDVAAARLGACDRPIAASVGVAIWRKTANDGGYDPGARLFLFFLGGGGE